MARMIVGLVMSLFAAGCTPDPPTPPSDPLADFGDCKFTSVDRPWSMEIVKTDDAGNFEATLTPENDQNTQPDGNDAAPQPQELEGVRHGETVVIRAGSEETTYRLSIKPAGQCVLEKVSGSMPDRFFFGPMEATPEPEERGP